MKKASLSFLHNLSDEEKIFANMIADKIYAADEKYRQSFTFFLTEAQSELARSVIAAYSFENYLFYGGYDGAERTMLGIFPEYAEPCEKDFPIAALSFYYRGQDKLSHRDFLGSLMALNISRETVGDILVNDGAACVFLTETAAEDVKRSVTKIGRVGVKIACGYDEAIVPEHSFREISGTVSSLRLDCVVSLAARCSRTKAERLIAGGSVSVRGRTEISGSKKLDGGDTFSVRGYGKFILDKIGENTKKERTFIELKKFI